MTNAVTQSYDAAVHRAGMLRLYERNLNGKVAAVLSDHEKRLDDLLLKSSDKKLLDEELTKTYNELERVSGQSLIALMKDQISFQWQTMDAAIGKLWRTSRPNKFVPEEFVLKQPLADNDTLREGWARINKAERTRIEQIIRRGIAENLTEEEIAVRVRRGNIHKLTRAQSEALTITAITSVTAQADHAVYEANAGALLGWQYVAVLDTRTSEICRHRDGHIYKINQRDMLPPAHYRCRSTTVPIFKSYSQMGELEGVAQVRRQNLKKLSKAQIAFYDGQTPLRETYDEWLKRQPVDVQLKHLGEYEKVRLLNEGKLSLDRFDNPEKVGLNELKRLTYDTPVGDSRRFAIAKNVLDSMQLGAANVDQLISDEKMFKTLRDYYILQSKDLDGNLSLTNYRGALLHTKKAQKQRVLSTLPREDQLRFNPITGRYEDTRLYQPSPPILMNALRRVDDSADILDRDKLFIHKMVDDLELKMSVNERAVIADNLRIILGRQRKDGVPWGNLKGVIQAQLKYDITNISEALEIQIRTDSNPFKKLLQESYIDPVLGPVQLQDLHDKFLDNIRARNLWEDRTAPKIASELRPIFGGAIPYKIRRRLTDRDLQQFYLRFAHRLAFSQLPDRDALAVALGRDLYNLANLNGSRNEWYNLGLNLIESKRASKFYALETYGVQKRRMRSRMSGQYFGPYYDTQTWTLRVIDPRIQAYSKLQRSVDLGLRVAVTDDKNRLVFRPGFKTYFIDRGIMGYEDTRIPITSTSSFSDFPEDFLDKDMVDALNWTANAKYRIDNDFFDFVDKLVYFEDDRGQARKFNELNELRKYLMSRGDTYERFKTMAWLRKKDSSFSNHPFIDHRARIYDRGLISPQSGETFRPFLNTDTPMPLGVDGFNNLQDQIGAFLGGLDEVFEGNFNNLTITGRQKIAKKWRKDLVEIGNAALRVKPADLRFILEHPMVSRIDGEEQGKFFRLAIEQAKINTFLEGDYSESSLARLASYKTAFAIEQDASSSGAQIIALTTKNKQLAQLSNVVPTTQKRRLYDEIAARTFSDPRFRVLNERLGLKEKDLQKAAKAQNMVTFYGAGERTGMLNVEGKLSKVLGKDKDVLVVKASERDTVLQEIDARIARLERYDPEGALEMRALRQNIRDVFNKGLDPGDEIMDQLYFLSPQTREFVEKLTMSYEKVVTPDDFKAIAQIMSEYLAEETPILKDFTKFFGRLAQDYLANAKPSSADFDWKSILKITLLGEKDRGYVLPDNVSRILGVKAGEPVSEKVLKRFGFWTPNGTLADIIYGVSAPSTRRVGATYLKTELAQVKTLTELQLFYSNNLPKSWTRVPWVNFDKKTLEQVFTQAFEERLRYRNKEGEWFTNILQIDQKTEATWWEQVINKSGKINDIADATRARTAFAVNGNHSNDAVIVKRFHLWGRKNKVATSTVHDAFFTNIGNMQRSREALREIYSDLVSNTSIKDTLDEMKARGLPKEIYDKYLQEAIDTGLIPVPGRSVVGGKVLQKEDILTPEDILEKIENDFKEDKGWYGVG